MASVRSTLWMVWIVLVLFLVVAAVSLGWGWWQQRAVRLDIAAAEAKIQEGKPAEAELLLSEHLDQGGRPSGAWVDQALDLRFQALGDLVEKTTDPKQQAQYKTTEQTLADRVLDAKQPWVRPGQAAWAQAHLILATVAMETNKAEAAQPHIQAVLGLPEGTPGRDDAQLAMCRIKMANGAVVEAQKELQALLDKLPEGSDNTKVARTRSGVEFALGQCNMVLLKSPEPQEGDEIYVLQRGDTLDRLRRKFKISPEVLVAINYPLNPLRLTIGRRIKIPHLEFSIVVSKADNTLTLFNHGKFFKKYPVRTGKSDYMTPVGNFRITSKMKDPPWRNPKTGQSYAGGAPGNELGCRWMSFQDASLGIHEASDPSSIGTYSSNGCVGMRKEDVIELFDLVPTFTPVSIVNKRTGTVGIPLANPAGPAAATGAVANPATAGNAPAAGAAQDGNAAGGEEESAATPTPTPKAKKSLRTGRTRVRRTTRNQS